MDQTIRSYHSNGSGGSRPTASSRPTAGSGASAAPRKRAPRTTKRAETPPRKATQTATLTREDDTLEAARPAVAEALAETADALELPGEMASVAPMGAGGVITLDDFEDIFTRFQTPLTNFVFRLVGNREQAYDLTQDVFVKAYRALASGTTIQAGALSSWLYRIASNTATDALRRRRLISWLPLSLFNEDRGIGAGMPDQDAANSQQPTEEEVHSASAAGALTNGYDGGRFEQHVADRDVVASVLKKLPPKYAECLLLYEHEGFSCAEIAEVLHVSPSAVKMRLMRARERFIELYQQETNG
jgi:RNA polymerase sigma-70 factor (ECF subfamily)